jgi:hypothetical protein
VQLVHYRLGYDLDRRVGRVRRVALGVAAGMFVVFVVIVAIALALGLSAGVSVAVAAFLAIFSGGGIGFLIAARIETSQNE